MREIKFRAWDKKEKQMIDINYLEIYDDLDKKGFHSVGEVLNNEDWEVMQYTGLKDSKGKEICEGDIVRVREEDGFQDDWSIHKVVYEAEEYKYPAFDLQPQIDFESNALQYFTDIDGEIEVIGNIYENPELLK